jgi:serine/threonine-protein kinase
MAQVFRGTDTVLGRTIAIKVLAPQYARDEGFVQRFRREAQSAARLNHPTVVSVYDTGSDSDVHFIVMEYVPGRTLAEVLKDEGRLQPERAVEIASQVAEALSFAHAAGIVHRDVKPGNIMLTPQGEVKLMDLGIARAMSTETLTQTATVLGTASYISPEQAQGEPVDARSDIYSLGVVLYEMLTGQPPFAAETPVAVAYKHVREEPTRPSHLVPEISEDIEAVVLKAMAKNPANRYASAEEMRADLERLTRGEPVQATPVLPPEETTVFMDQARETTVLPAPLPDEQGGRARRIWATVLVVLLVLAILGVALFFLARSLLDQDAPRTNVRVPELVGMNIEAARLLLERRDLEAEETFEPSGEPQGTVIRQSPDPETRVERGTVVRLVVSGGPEQIRVPSIVGRTPEEARGILEAEGLALGDLLATNESENVPEGAIISSDPPAGQLVDAGTQIDYILSGGREQIPVPDLECETITTARRELQERGFRVDEEGQDPGGPNFNCPQSDRVSRTDPGAGTLLDPGSTVRIFFSFAPPTTPAPTTPAPTTPAPTTPPPTTAPPTTEPPTTLPTTVIAT